MNKLEILPLNLEQMIEAATLRRHAFEQALPDFPQVHTLEDDIGFWCMRHGEGADIVGVFEQRRLLGVMMSGPGWIDQLYIGVGNQGRGLGRLLLDHAKMQMPEIQLWTFQQNFPARRFYEANGFVAVEETDGADNEERRPDVRYRWVAG